MARVACALSQRGAADVFRARILSFVELSDPTLHREYNEWHQLDHRPENLLLPGVAWGDRWTRARKDADLGEASAPEYARVDYVVMWWFRPPYAESITAWTKLGEDFLPVGSRAATARGATPLPWLLHSGDGLCRAACQDVR